MEQNKILKYSIENLPAEHSATTIHHNYTHIQKHKWDFDLEINYMIIDNKPYYSFVKFPDTKKEFERTINDKLIIEFYKNNWLDISKPNDFAVQKFTFSGESVEYIRNNFRNIPLYKIRLSLLAILKYKLEEIFDTNNLFTAIAFEHLRPDHKIFKQYKINYLNCVKTAQEKLPNNVHIDKKYSVDVITRAILQEIQNQLGNKWLEFKYDLLWTLPNHSFHKYISEVNREGLFEEFNDEEEVEELIYYLESFFKKF